MQLSNRLAFFIVLLAEACLTVTAERLSNERAEDDDKGADDTFSDWMYLKTKPVMLGTYDQHEDAAHQQWNTKTDALVFIKPDDDWFPNAAVDRNKNAHSIMVAARLPTDLDVTGELFREKVSQLYAKFSHLTFPDGDASVFNKYTTRDAFDAWRAGKRVMEPRARQNPYDFVKQRPGTEVLGCNPGGFGEYHDGGFVILQIGYHCKDCKCPGQHLPDTCKCPEGAKDIGEKFKGMRGWKFLGNGYYWLSGQTNAEGYIFLGGGEFKGLEPLPDGWF